MTNIVFENTNDCDLTISVNGRVKVHLEPQDRVTLSIKEGSVVGLYGEVSANPKSKKPSGNALDKGEKRKLRPAQAIHQIDEKGQLVKTHPSMKAASVAAKVAWFKLTQHFRDRPDELLNGFYWQKAEGDLPPKPVQIDKALEPRKRRAGKSVLQCTMDGKVIKQWSSQSLAADELGIDKSSISKVCNNAKGWSSAGGYTWKFAA